MEKKIQEVGKQFLGSAQLIEKRLIEFVPR